MVIGGKKILLFWVFICKVLALLSKAAEKRPILFELIGQKLIISVAGL